MLLGTPPQVQPALNLVSQDQVAGQPAALGTGQAPQSHPMSSRRAYRPALSRLRRTSRLTVDAGRPSSRPIARKLMPARTRSPIRTRSSSDKNL